MKLIEFTKQGRLDLYKAAVVDWMQFPYDYDKKTTLGLCWYLFKKHDVLIYDDCVEMCDEWMRHVESKTDRRYSAYIDKKGKPEKRIEALRNMIAQLEQELLNEMK